MLSDAFYKGLMVRHLKNQYLSRITRRNQRPTKTIEITIIVMKFMVMTEYDDINNHNNNSQSSNRNNYKNHGVPHFYGRVVLHCTYVVAFTRLH